MSHKERIESFLIGGLSGLMVVAAYLVMHAWSSGANAGDWLGFAGALLGTILAIGGAIFVEHYRRKMERNDELRLLRSALSRITMGANVLVGDGLPEGLNIEGKRGHYLDALSNIHSGFGIIIYAKERLNFALKNPELFSDLQRVELHLKLSEKDRLAEERILSTDNLTEAVLNVMQEKLSFEVGALGYCSDQAVQRIDRQR
ncbi:hypothetical protein [Sphingobium sp. Z007]|uniref:hypothetical protein n=1 Tax=Sphingobium sp. Z007 TaxID=627495 RepID=UPI000B4A047A|nr:hypothetical protein [Sphingobium sp. Z007]